MQRLCPPAQVGGRDGGNLEVAFLDDELNG